MRKHAKIRLAHAAKSLGGSSDLIDTGFADWDIDWKHDWTGS
tara:strand:+ start:14511 stop:14636 length:126 start_codon:yes stop_codon:yes gene_type:complete